MRCVVTNLGKNAAKVSALATATFAFVVAGLAQTTEPFPIPDSYRVEGIPVIKKGDVENLFYDPASIRSNLIWDADQRNRRLLVTDQTNNIYLLDSPLSQPVKLVEKVVPGTVKVRPDGRAFAYSSDSEDEDNFQIFLYDFEKKTSTKLIALKGKDESIDSFVWSRKGDAIHYIRADYDLKKSTLCTYDFKKEICSAAGMKGVWEVMDVEQGKALLKYWKASSAQHLYLHDATTSKLAPIDDVGNCRRAFLSSGKILWTSEEGEVCERAPCILSMDIKSKKRGQLRLPADMLTINDVKISPNGNNLLITGNRDGVDFLRLFEIKSNLDVLEVKPFLPNSYAIWHTRWLSNNEVAYTIENSGKPASIQSFDINTRRVTDWTKAKLPSILDGKVTVPQVIKWKSFDQREVTGYIIRPNSPDRKLPVLIDIHGGPQMLDRPLFNSQDIRLSSNLELAIIHTNIRGSSGFGREFMDADNKEKRADAVKDVQTLLDWIAKQPDLDADRIFVRGGSYGGFIALSTALQEPKRIKGVIAEYPLVSIRGMLSMSWVDEFAKNEYGDPKDESLMASLDNLSPLNNARRWNNIPLLLTRGKLDSRNPEKDIVDLKNQLKNRGTDVWFVYSNTDGHGFGGRYLFAAVYMFLKTNLKEN